MNEILFSSKKEDWETPQDLFDELDKEFHFTVDVASSNDNYKVKKHYTKKEDGLLQNWDNEVVWCNPPYGRQIGQWVHKAFYSRANTVMLLPARTDTKWFHEYIYKKNFVKIRFLKGRLKFGNSKNSAPFPSMIVIFEQI
jgi:site-specific DNA-methyltransferase (adenine-specific)